MLNNALDVFFRWIPFVNPMRANAYNHLKIWSPKKKPRARRGFDNHFVNKQCNRYSHARMDKDKPLKKRAYTNRNCPS